MKAKDLRAMLALTREALGIVRQIVDNEGALIEKCSPLDIHKLVQTRHQTWRDSIKLMRDYIQDSKDRSMHERLSALEAQLTSLGCMRRDNGTDVDPIRVILEAMRARGLNPEEHDGRRW